MQPPLDERRKPGGPDPDGPNRRRQRLLTIRTTLIILLALLTALGGVALLLAARTEVWRAVFSGFGILAAAIWFYDKLIAEEN